jgi:hypothetical protein
LLHIGMPVLKTRTKHELFYMATCLLAVATLSIGVSCSSASRDNQNLTSGSENTTQSDSNGGSWSIFLLSFSGEGATSRASTYAQVLQTDWGLEDVYVEPRDTGAAVLYGRYTELDSTEAQKDLARVRSLGAGKRKLFASAFLLFKQDGGLGRYPDIALVSARKEFGNGTLFTLQIGVYESQNRAESRRAAEDAALTLRQQGEQAYYHHGPSRSMVTVGVFSLRDYDPQTGNTSDRLIKIRERFPNNLFNGMGLREHTGARSARLQTSALVMIPE